MSDQKFQLENPKHPTALNWWNHKRKQTIKQNIGYQHFPFNKPPSFNVTCCAYRSKRVRSRWKTPKSRTITTRRLLRSVICIYLFDLLPLLKLLLMFPVRQPHAAADAAYYSDDDDDCDDACYNKLSAVGPQSQRHKYIHTASGRPLAPTPAYYCYLLFCFCSGAQGLSSSSFSFGWWSVI